MRKITVLGLLLLLGLLAGSAAIADLRMHVGTAGVSLTLGNPPLSASVFTPNTPNGVVGTLSATASDGSTPSWSIVGANSGGFHVINGNTLVQAAAGTACSTYADLQARVTAPTAVNTPQTFSLSLTPSSSCAGPTPGSVAIVQSLTTHGAPILGSGPDGTQKLVWPFAAVTDWRGVTGKTIGAGDTIVGYMHTISNQGKTIWPRAVTDNLGHSYTVTPSQVWNPYVTSPGEGENIGIFYLSNIPAGVNTLTFDFTNYAFGTNHDVNWQDIGFVEYSGVSSINAVVNPVNTGSVQNNQLTITPTAQSVIWALGATDNNVTDGSDLLTPGYSILVAAEQGKDGIGIWGSNQSVPAGPLTLNWNNSYWNQSTCADASAAGATGCTVILAAVSLTGTPAASTFDVSRNTGNHFSFSSDKLTATISTTFGTYDSAFTNLFHSTGKWDFRFTIPAGCNHCAVGMSTLAERNDQRIGNETQSFAIFSDGSTLLNNASFGTTGLTFNTGSNNVDLIVDIDRQTVQEVVNGGTPSAALSVAGLSLIELSPAWTSGAPGESITFNGAPSVSYSGAIAWDGSSPPLGPPAFSSVQMNCGSNCGFTSGTAGQVGTASATLSSGSFTGAWNFKTSGTATNPPGTSCTDQTANFTINGSSGVVSNTVGAAAGSYTVCPQATQTGVSNSPYSQAVTVTGTAPGSVSTFDTSRNSASPALTFANSNRTATSHNSSWSTAFTTLFHNSGTWYFRFVMGPQCGTSCGVGMATASETNSNYVGESTQSFGIYQNGALWINGASPGQSTGLTAGPGAVVDLRVDLAAHTIQEAVNGGALSSPISIAGLASYNLSPAWTGATNDSVTFVGGPPAAYGTTQWDGGASPQTPLAVSFIAGNPVSVSNGAKSGDTISGISVSTSNGAPFAGTVTITTQSSAGLTNLSSTTLPSNVRAARDFTLNDNGTRTVTVTASENGVTTSPATLTMNVAGVFVSNCDIGPSAVVPPGATAANFNYCFLNADFTQNVSVNGVNFTNENTWLVECTGAPVGGTGITGTTTYFSIKLLDPFGYVNPSANFCGHSPIVTDQGSTVLDHVLTRSDYVNFGATFSRLMWPHIDGAGIPVSGPGGPVGGPRGKGMNYWNYTEVTFRIPPSSLTQAFTQDSSIMDFYMNGNGSGFEGYNEIDFFETHIGWYNWGGVPGALRMNGAGACNVNNGADNGCSAFDVTNYHAYGMLTTWDGTFRAEQCFYVDNVLLPQGCQDWNEAALLCCGLPYTTGQNPDPGTTALANYTFWNSAQSCYGGGNGCAPQDFHIYIKSLRLFACNTFWNDLGCVGLYTGGGWRAGENQPKDQPRSMFASLRHFIENDAEPVLVAELDSIWKYLVGTAIAAEQADPFLDGHLGGTWKCSDGTFYNKACKPNEFYDSGFSAEWWKECLPNHTDCIWSETAINGMRKTPAGEVGTRGPGWCYTSQPFTCSPDGRVPQ